MSSLKPVSVDGVTYQVPEAIADAYGTQLAASQNGKGPAPSADMITNAAQASGNNFGTGGDTGTGGAVTSGADLNAPLTQSDPIDFTHENNTTNVSPPGNAIGGAANADGTPFDGSTGPIGAASAGPDDPEITVRNTSSTPRYYKIEASAGCDPQSLNNNIFVLQPGQSAKVNAGPGFIGAITDEGSAITADNSGTRQEVNFGTPGKTWYDADLERGGATHSTLGPTDTSMLADDGANSLVGDQYAYLTPGSVAGQTTDAAGAADDLKNRVISTQKMTITSA